MTQARDVLSSGVASAIATQEAARGLIATMGHIGPVTIAPSPPPASSAALDILSAEIARAKAVQGVAVSIIGAHAKPLSLPTGKVSINIVRDTTSPVKWADNPNAALADAVLDWVVAALEANLASVADISITITVGWKYISGLPVQGGAIGQSLWFINGFKYNEQIRPALQALKKNSLQALAFNNANLPPDLGANNPQPNMFYTTYPLAMAIGLMPPTNFGTTGWMSFGDFDFDYTPDGRTCARGKYSFCGVVLHEITEWLGRSCELSDYFGDIKSYPRPLSRNGARFCSPDGVGVIVQYNQNPGGDAGDLAGVGGNSAFDAFGTPGFAPCRSATQALFEREWQNLTLDSWPLSKTGVENGGIAP